MGRVQKASCLLVDVVRTVLWAPMVVHFEAPYCPDGSRLLAELVRLPQPLCARYPTDTTRRQYRIDFGSRTVRHETKCICSATFFIDANATDDEWVALHGLTCGGNEWRIDIVRGPEEKAGQKSYLATIAIGKIVFKDRVIQCAPNEE